MIIPPKRKKPTLGQLAFGEIVGPVDFDEDSDHPLRVDRPESDGMEADYARPVGLPRDVVEGGYGDDVLTGDAGNDDNSDDIVRRHTKSISGTDGGDVADAFPDVRSTRLPTDSPVDVESLYKILQFDPSGPNEDDRLDEALGRRNKRPDSPNMAEAIDAAWQAFNARTKTFSTYLRGRFSDLKDSAGNPVHIRPGTYRHDIGNNDGVDAFRHTLWSFMLAREIGPHRAKIWQDAHEVSPGGVGSHLMDLYNNNVGHWLAMNPENKDRDPVEVVLEALVTGMLQTKPFIPAKE